MCGILLDLCILTTVDFIGANDGFVAYQIRLTVNKGPSSKEPQHRHFCLGEHTLFNIQGSLNHVRQLIVKGYD